MLEVLVFRIPLWALILPGALSVYNSIICKTAIESVPESLKESAYIDGANDVIILFKIIVPLIKATLAFFCFTMVLLTGMHGLTHLFT